LNKTFETHSASDTLILGERIGQLLKAGDNIFLFGDLGAGKTTLTQGMARGLGVSKNEYVRSPSFTLVNEYSGRMPVFHIDLYRIDSSPDLENLGLEETFNGKGVVIVEWAEKLFAGDEPLAPLLGIEHWLEIHITIGPNESRKLDLKTPPMEAGEHPVFALH